MSRIVVKKHILESLNAACEGFESAKKDKKNPAAHTKMLHFSKVAVLDLGGWLEVAQLDMVRLALRASSRKHGFSSEKKLKSIKGRSSNFLFETFTRLLSYSMGMDSYHSFESKLPQAQVILLSKKLETLKGIRDGLAHQFKPGAPITIAPRDLRTHYFEPLYKDLRMIELELRKALK